MSKFSKFKKDYGWNFNYSGRGRKDFGIKVWSSVGICQSYVFSLESELVAGCACNELFIISVMNCAEMTWSTEIIGLVQDCSMSSALAMEKPVLC